jgi:hypothetical protein
VAAARDQFVSGARDRVGDLPAQMGRGDQVVSEGDDLAADTNVTVCGEPVVQCADSICARCPGPAAFVSSKTSIQSANAASSLRVRGDSEMRACNTAAYRSGSRMPTSSRSISARARAARSVSVRPRVAMRTAWLTNSGRARASSWATKAPREVPTSRQGARFRRSMSPATSSTVGREGVAPWRTC